MRHNRLLLGGFSAACGRPQLHGGEARLFTSPAGSSMAAASAAPGRDSTAAAASVGQHVRSCRWQLAVGAAALAGAAGYAATDEGPVAAPAARSTEPLAGSAARAGIEIGLRAGPGQSPGSWPPADGSLAGEQVGGAAAALHDSVRQLAPAVLSPQVAHCSVATSADHRGGPPPADVKRLLDWLMTSGGDTAAVEIRQSSLHPEHSDARASGAGDRAPYSIRQAPWPRQLWWQLHDATQVPAGGLGVYLSDSAVGVSRVAQAWPKRLWWRITGGAGPEVELASFPLARAITAESPLRDPVLGPTYRTLYRQLSAEPAFDDRALVQLYLMIERMRGEESAYSPWLRLLPHTFSTPLFYPDEELELLKGTSLYKATQAKRAQLEATWHVLKAPASVLLRAAGVQGRASFNDFLWAYSVFWSRAKAVPGEAGGWGVAAVEAVVPGLDFCNHSVEPSCRWSVDAEAHAAGSTRPAGGGKVSLVAPARYLPAPGDELTISYGDKGNEELLFLYGFTLEQNPHDALMVACPLPPAAEWDDVMHGRAALLGGRGLSPRFFLPADLIDDRPKADGARSELRLPEGVVQTLEALVMDPRQLAAELSALDGAENTGASATPVKATVELSPAEASGLRMAALTTLTRLLEMKVLELEGDDGSGPLENDVALLQAAKGDGLSPNQRNCIIYRAGQKRIAREYLLRGQAALAAEVAKLESLMVEGAREEGA